MNQGIDFQNKKFKEELDQESMEVKNMASSKIVRQGKSQPKVSKPNEEKSPSDSNFENNIQPRNIMSSDGGLLIGRKGVGKKAQVNNFGENQEKKTELGGLGVQQVQRPMTTD
mmetsp:Transcript_22945/g.22269  ORF Transcript_22945/g.22269 Transcript_22945/m.22269 type:complete len:113 (+) Transcript_22945:2365-2703(+)